MTCKTDLTSYIFLVKYVSQESDYLKRLCMWPSRNRNTETGSGNSTCSKDFSSMSWTREGPHMSTQAARVSHW